MTFSGNSFCCVKLDLDHISNGDKPMNLYRIFLIHQVYSIAIGHNSSGIVSSGLFEAPYISMVCKM